MANAVCNVLHFELRSFTTSQHFMFDHHLWKTWR